MSKKQQLEETKKKVDAMPNSDLKKAIQKDIETKQQHDVKKG